MIALETFLPHTIKVTLDENGKFGLSGKIVSFYWVEFGEDELLMVDSETGEVLFSRPMFQTFAKEQIEKRSDMPEVVLKWKWFAGVSSSKELQALHARYKKFIAGLMVPADIEFANAQMTNEFVLAMKSYFPIQQEYLFMAPKNVFGQKQATTGDWIDLEFRRLKSSGRSESGLWFSYRDAVYNKQLLPTKQHLEKIAKLLNYQSGWVWHKGKELSLW